MKIEMQRCRIREFQAEDLAAFMAYHNDLDWMKYQGFKGLTAAEYQQILLNSQTTMTDGQQFAIVTQKTPDLVGDLYLKQEESTIWLGYTIAPRFARQGYATEAITGILQWLSIRKTNYTIKAAVEPGNMVSRHLLMKLGFQMVATQDDIVVYQLSLRSIH